MGRLPYGAIGCFDNVDTVPRPFPALLLSPKRRKGYLAPAPIHCRGIFVWPAATTADARRRGLKFLRQISESAESVTMVIISIARGGE
jgi:hypothetical protein